MSKVYFAFYYIIDVCMYGQVCACTRKPMCSHYHVKLRRNLRSHFFHFSIYVPELKVQTQVSGLGKKALICIDILHDLEKHVLNISEVQIYFSVSYSLVDKFHVQKHIKMHYFYQGKLPCSEFCFLKFSTLLIFHIYIKIRFKAKCYIYKTKQYRLIKKSK